jgi:hypothetical protein
LFTGLVCRFSSGQILSIFVIIARSWWGGSIRSFLVGWFYLCRVCIKPVQYAKRWLVSSFS